MSHTLTSVDLKALRQADDVCFDLRVKVEGKPDESVIRCIKRKDDSDPFADDITYRIETDYTLWGDEFSGESPLRYGFAMVNAAKYSDTYSTFAALVKVGDVITAEWHANGAQNEYMRKAGLNADTLRLTIRRADARSLKVHRYTFEIAQSHCPDNSARMIKRNPLF